MALTVHPPEVCAAAEKLLKDYVAALRAVELAGDAKVYSQEEWIDRRERYGTNGAAVLCFDGSRLYEVFNCYDMGKCAQKWQQRFESMLKQHGFWYEIGEAWFLYIYKDDAMHPLYDPWGFMLGLCASLDRDRKRKQAEQFEDAQEAVRRCGFTIEYRDRRVMGEVQHDILNARGEALNATEKKELGEQFRIVLAERAERQKKAQQAREEEIAARKAAQQAEYDRIAAPYREERLRRRAEAWAKRQPKQKP